MLARARILNEIGRANEAGPIAEAVLPDIPQTEPCWLQLAYQLIAYGRLASGKRLDAEFYADRALSCAPQGTLAKACDRLLRARIAHPKQARLLYSRAFSFSGMYHLLIPS